MVPIKDCAMKKFTHQEAKAVITKLCESAENNGFPTRDSFFDMLALNPLIAAKGYNYFGKIFYWNNASVTLYGHRMEEAINKDLVELIIPPDMQKFARDMIALGGRSGKMPDPGTFDLIHADGHYVTVFSGHLAFSWGNSSTPEFYCLDLPIITNHGMV